jgi:hypothetical protein
MAKWRVPESHNEQRPHRTQQEGSEALAGQEGVCLVQGRGGAGILMATGNNVHALFCVRWPVCRFAGFLSFLLH